MDILFSILLPLVISSLGFLSYRHPQIARQILKPLLYLTVISFFLLGLFSLITSNIYNKTIDATRINFDRQQTKDINLDSLYKTINGRDSINLILLGRRYQREKLNDIYTSQIEIRDSIKNNIINIEESSRQTNNTYLLYCFAAFLIGLILYGLSFLFDNIHNKETISDINSTKDQTE